MINASVICVIAYILVGTWTKIHTSNGCTFTQSVRMEALALLEAKRVLGENDDNSTENSFQWMFAMNEDLMIMTPETLQNEVWLWMWQRWTPEKPSHRIQTKTPHLMDKNMSLNECFFGTNMFPNEKKHLDKKLVLCCGRIGTCSHSCMHLICEPFESVIYIHLSNQRPHIFKHFVCLCASHSMWFAIETAVFSFGLVFNGPDGQWILTICRSFATRSAPFHFFSFSLLPIQPLPPLGPQQLITKIVRTHFRVYQFSCRMLQTISGFDTNTMDTLSTCHDWNRAEALRVSPKCFSVYPLSV